MAERSTPMPLVTPTIPAVVEAAGYDWRGILIPADTILDGDEVPQDTEQIARCSHQHRTACTAYRCAWKMQRRAIRQAKEHTHAE